MHARTASAPRAPTVSSPLRARVLGATCWLIAMGLAAALVRYGGSSPVGDDAPSLLRLAQSWVWEQPLAAWLLGTALLRASLEPWLPLPLHTGAGRRSDALELVVTLAVVALAALGVRSELVAIVQIPSGSMEPLLHPGDLVWISKVGHGPVARWLGIRRSPERGEVVLVRGEPFHGDTPFVVKRVFARGGDTVEVQGGRVRLQGVGHQRCPGPVEQGRALYYERADAGWYLVDDPAVFGGSDRTTSVPDGRLYLVGDHRAASFDSRHLVDAHAGTIAEEDVVGVARQVLFSREQSGAWTFLRSGLGVGPRADAPCAGAQHERR